MASRANQQGAIDLLLQVLWNEPTAGDPQSLTLELIEYLADDSQFERSLRLAKTLYQASAKGASRLPVATMASGIAETSKLPNQRAFWFGELDRLEPFVHETVINRVRALLDLNRNIEARVAIEAFLKEKPDWRTAELVKQLARTWINDDDVKARQFIKDSLRIQKQAESFILLGRLEEQRQNRMNAIDAYRDALELEPKLTKIRRVLAELLLKSGDLDDAASQLKIITTQKPGDIGSREKLADIYRDLGRPRLALEEYLAIMRYSKASQDVLMKAARLQLYDLGKLAAASRTLKRILQINPKNAEARYRLGVALKDQEQIQAAKAQFERYLELAPQGEFAQEVQGELLNLNAR
jgi:tetratricopeptide (TPR) repeat protein